MRELIGKVAISDGTTASALQVIAHFDVLADQRASVGSILRAPRPRPWGPDPGSWTR